MIPQRLALKLIKRGLLGRVGPWYLHRTTWRIQSGAGRGLRFRLSHNPDYITGTNEPSVQKALTRHLRLGNVVYDVGANIGFFTVLAAQAVGSAGYVYAFEPVTANIALVRENAALNGFEHVEAFELAIGNQTSSAELHLASWLGGSSLAAHVIPAEEQAGVRTVQVTTLDQIIRERRLRPPTLIKIDVEGTEREALEGMSNTLRQYKPVVLFEVDDGDRGNFEKRWAELDAFTLSHGYQIEHLENAYPNTTWFVGHTLALPLPD